MRSASLLPFKRV